MELTDSDKYNISMLLTAVEQYYPTKPSTGRLVRRITRMLRKYFLKDWEYQGAGGTGMLKSYYDFFNEVDNDVRRNCDGDMQQLS